MVYFLRSNGWRTTSSTRSSMLFLGDLGLGLGQTHIHTSRRSAASPSTRTATEKHPSIRTLGAHSHLQCLRSYFKGSIDRACPNDRSLAAEFRAKLIVGLDTDCSGIRDALGAEEHDEKCIVYCTTISNLVHCKKGGENNFLGVFLMFGLKLFMLAAG